MKQKYFDDCIHFLNEAKTVQFKNPRELSFLEGNIGLLSIFVVVCKFEEFVPKEILQKKDEYLDQILTKGEKCSFSKEACNELLYGRTGFLYSLLFILKYFPNEQKVRKLAALVGKKIVEESIAYKYNGKDVFMYEWHDSKYLGLAHGVTGILYVLIAWLQFEKKQEISSLLPDEIEKIGKKIKDTFEFLISTKRENGNYPTRPEATKVELVQFCHGCPGFSLLFSFAIKSSFF